MVQSGHGEGHDVPVWQQMAADYARLPAKPVLDVEPNYEDHPVSPWPAWNPANGYFRDHAVRKQTYRSVFAGGCGVTYGHHAIWQFCGPNHAGINHVEMSWTAALNRPGATQMGLLRSLIESRPFFSRIPDQQLSLDAPTMPAAYATATRAADGSYAFVYVPNASQTITVQLDRLSGSSTVAWWFDPRTGTAEQFATISARGPRSFTTPATGPDWVLVLDDAARNFGPPGATH